MTRKYQQGKGESEGRRKEVIYALFAVCRFNRDGEIRLRRGIVCEGLPQRLHDFTRLIPFFMYSQTTRYSTTTVVMHISLTAKLTEQFASTERVVRRSVVALLRSTLIRRVHHRVGSVVQIRPLWYIADSVLHPQPSPNSQTTTRPDPPHPSPALTPPSHPLPSSMAVCTPPRVIAHDNIHLPHLTVASPTLSSIPASPLRAIRHRGTTTTTTPSASASFSHLPLELLDTIVSHVVSAETFPLRRTRALSSLSLVHPLLLHPAQRRSFASPLIETSKQARRLVELVKSSKRVAGYVKEVRVESERMGWVVKELKGVAEECGNWKKVTMCGVWWDVEMFEERESLISVGNVGCPRGFRS